MTSRYEQFKKHRDDPNMKAMLRPGGGVSFVPVVEYTNAISQNYKDAGDQDLNNTDIELRSAEEDKDDIDVFNSYASDPNMRPVIRPHDNGFSFIPVSSWDEAMKNNYRGATQKEVQHEYDKRKYGSGWNQVGAAASGALRGITFGLSDPLTKYAAAAIDTIGSDQTFQEHLDQTEDQMRKAKEYNPGLSLGTEITGAILPAILSGGSTTIATGAGATSTAVKLARLTPAGAIARTARAGEVAIAAKLGGGRAAKVLSKALGGAAEGAAFGAGQDVSHWTLEKDAEFTGEMTVLGAGFGGLGGAAFGSLFDVAIPAGAKGVSKVIDKLSWVGESGLGKVGKDKMKSAWTKLSSWRTGIDEDELINAFDKVGDELTTAPHMQKRFAALIADPTLLRTPNETAILGLTNNADEAAIYHALSGAIPGDINKIDKIRRSIDYLDEVTKTKMIERFSNQINETMGYMAEHSKIVSSLLDSTSAVNMANKINVSGPAIKATELMDGIDNIVDNMLVKKGTYLPDSVNKLKDIIKEVQTDLVAQARTGVITTKVVHDVLRTAKRNIDMLSEFNNASIPKASEATIDKIRGIGIDINKHLVDQQIYGNYAKEFASVASEVSALGNAKAAMLGSFGDEVIINGISTKRISQAKILNHFKNIRSPASQTGKDALKQWVDAMDDIISKQNIATNKTLVSYRVHPTNALKIINKRATWDSIAKQTGAKNILDIKTLALVGLAVQPGIGGELAVLAVQAGKYPIKEAKLINMINGAVIATKNKTVRMLNGIAKSKTSDKLSGATMGGLPASLTGLKLGITRRKKKKGESDLDARIEEIRALGADPETTVAKIEENTKVMGSMLPDTTMAMRNTTIKGLGILTRAIPKQTQTDPYNPRSVSQVSDNERAKFSRTYTAVRNPISVIEDLSNGIVNLEGVSVLKEMYPKYYEFIVQNIMDMLATKDLPYQVRLKLLSFIGGRDENTQRLQSIYITAQPEETKQSNKKKSKKVSESSNKRMFESQQSQAEKITFK